MGLQNARLTDVAYIAAAAASVYTNPAATKTYVRGMIIHNTNTSSETVVINYVSNASGAVGTAAAANRIFRLSLAADETLLIEFPYIVILPSTNDSIQAVTTTASKVTIMLLGDKDV